MSFHRNLPIKCKIKLVIIVTCALALLAACGAMFVFQLLTFRRNFERDLTALAEIMANTTTAPLAFRDKPAAEENLGALKAKPHVLAAAVVRPDGQPFAQFGRQIEMDALVRFPTGRGFLYATDHLLLTEPIVLDGQVIGRLLLESDYGSVFRSLVRLYVGIVTLVLLGSMAIAFAVSWRLQRVISGPILCLTDAARRVAEKGDYSIRTEFASRDELGVLSKAFNQMLGRIQSREAALRQINEDLQREVAERKRTEAALLESRQRYEIAVLGSSDGLWDWKLASDEIYYSPRWKSMLGYDDTELPNRVEEWKNRLHPEDRDRVLTASEEYLAGTRPSFEVEFRLQHKDGGYRWILSRGAALRDAEGKPFRFAGSHTDITARKQSEAEVEALHKQLLETSRFAGMAEVATGVLHNVGNVLNSVNVSTTLVADRVKASKVVSLTRAATLLREHQDDPGAFLTRDPKGRQLPGFLISLAAHLETERDELLEELASLRQNVDHIKDIVAMQQNYARVSGVIETLPVQQLVEDALRINSAALDRHRIQLVKDFAEVPPVQMDKHKVLQILINLIRNAKYAMDESRAQDKRLTIGIGMNGNGRVKVSVGDNGVGIPPENLTRIFGHGFTTKRDGHGFGLHSGANAAKEMGGALYAQSAGVGQGATFVLELPLRRDESQS